jgi:hypothetical protein
MGSKDLPAYLCRVRCDGSASERITPAGVEACFGRFCPDGKRVLYTGEFKGKFADEGQLFVIGVGGGEPRRVTRATNGSYDGYCWSPDGKRIAYVWRRNEGGEGRPWETFLMVADADGSNDIVVLTEKAPDRRNTLGGPNWR